MIILHLNKGYALKKLHERVTDVFYRADFNFPLARCSKAALQVIHHSPTSPLLYFVFCLPFSLCDFIAAKSHILEVIRIKLSAKFDNNFLEQTMESPKKRKSTSDLDKSDSAGEFRRRKLKVLEEYADFSFLIGEEKESAEVNSTCNLN